MMDTILNLGLNDLRVQWRRCDKCQFRLQLLSAFIADICWCRLRHSQRRIRPMLRKTKNSWVRIMTFKEEHQSLIQQYTELYQEHYQISTKPRATLRCYQSGIQIMNNPRAKVYRELNYIPHDLGSWLLMSSMVFNSDQKAAQALFSPEILPLVNIICLGNFAQCARRRCRCR